MTAMTLFTCYCGRSASPHAPGCFLRGKPFYGEEKAATVAALPTPYGCHNRPPLGAPRVVQDGWIPGLVVRSELTHAPRMREVPHRMSTECQHPSAADPRCEGCRWRRGA